MSETTPPQGDDVEASSDAVEQDIVAAPDLQPDAGGVDIIPEIVVDGAAEGDAGGADLAEDSAESDGNSDDPLEAEGEIAADYLEELLDIADLDGDIDTFVEGGRAHVSIVTEGDQLVGKNGEVLDALQELARLAVMSETGRRSRLMLDVAGHREHRRKELQALAADAINDVKSSGEPVRLTPMNPFERKIVHDVVAAAGLVSESEGEEPRRRVVVQPV